MAKRMQSLIPEERPVPPAVAAAIDAAHKLVIDAIEAEGTAMWRPEEPERLHWIMNRLGRKAHPCENVR